MKRGTDRGKVTCEGEMQCLLTFWHTLTDIHVGIPNRKDRLWAGACSLLSSVCGELDRHLWPQFEDTSIYLLVLEVGGGGKGIFFINFFFWPAGWWGGPDGQRWGVKSLFVRLDGSKLQVGHNSGVLGSGLSTALCVLEGGHSWS